jgi:trans-aconitate methyltransferase
MSTQDACAPATVWDSYHAAGEELNPEGWWALELLPYLTTARVRRVLDVGCGTGGNTVSLAQKALEIAAMDYSPVAIARALSKPRLYPWWSTSDRAIWRSRCRIEMPASTRS